MRTWQKVLPTDTQVTHSRIVVLGVTGSGKTTFATQIGQRLGVPHIELDSLHWDANWTPAGKEEFRSKVAKALTGERWVVDGNYSVVRDLVWGRATTLVWLDYSFPRTFWRLARRTVRRIVRKELLWNGNRESARSAFFSADSIFVWLFRSYWKNRKEYPALFKQPEYAHLYVIQFRTPHEAQEWVETLP